MAQAIAGFDADAFRAGIRTAMLMGLPVEEARQPQFVTITAAAQIDTSADANGVPWDPTAIPVPSVTVKQRVVCALDWKTPGPVVEHFGERQPSVVVITLLDEEYAQIEGFTYVNIWPALRDEPVPYVYRRIVMQPTLDVVGVWQIECATEDSL